jgi:hypothetical protein
MIPLKKYKHNRGRGEDPCSNPFSLLSTPPKMQLLLNRAAFPYVLDII